MDESLEKWKKIPEGTRRVIDGREMIRHNGRWVLAQDVTPKMDELEVRQGKRGKEYRRKGDKDWKPVDDSQAGMVAQDMDVNTFNSERLAGVKKPEFEDKPKTKKPVRTVGQRTPGKPWEYDSPFDYLKAWAVAKPKTRIGRFVFDIVNTASWLYTWHENNKDIPDSPEKQSVEQGYEDALKNFHEWCGGIDPKTDVDDVKSEDLNMLYTNLEFKMKELEKDFNNSKGKTDPDSLRIKSEYRTYQKMYDNMKSALEGGASSSREEDARQRILELRQRKQNAMND